jgi:hypothetical protein
MQTIVRKPSQRRTTFSKCINANSETMETKAEPRHSHFSMRVGNAVFQHARWRAPNDAPKREQSDRMIFEW